MRLTDMELRRSARLALAALVSAAVAVAGCAADAPAASSDDPAATPEPTPSVSIRIGPDGPELPEDVVAELRAYGRRHADQFGGLYVNAQSRGSIVMLFTDDLEAHAAALAEIWPRVTVRGVRYTEAELVAVLESLDLAGMTSEGIEPLSAALDTINNVVTLELKSDDPTLEARLELRYGGMVDVTVYPFPGEWANVTEGDGWRLLAAGEGDGAEAYTVRAATDDAAWEQLWEALGIGGERPDVSMADEVVVSFGHGISSTCRERRLDDVVIDDGLVYSVTSDPLWPRNCTTDLSGAALFVVALDRDALPDDTFTLQLGPQRVTGGRFTEVIDVPLP